MTHLATALGVSGITRQESVCGTTALLDRLMHHCHIVEKGNESHRFLHSSATAKKRIKAR